jgi:hypothetical protein
VLKEVVVVAFEVLAVVVEIVVEVDKWMLFLFVSFLLWIDAGWNVD